MQTSRKSLSRNGTLGSRPQAKGALFARSTSHWCSRSTLRIVSLQFHHSSASAFHLNCLLICSDVMSLRSSLVELCWGGGLVKVEVAPEDLVGTLAAEHDLEAHGLNPSCQQIHRHCCSDLLPTFDQPRSSLPQRSLPDLFYPLHGTMNGHTCTESCPDGASQARQEASWKPHRQDARDILQKPVFLTCS